MYFGSVRESVVLDPLDQRVSPLRTGDVIGMHGVPTIDTSPFGNWQLPLSGLSCLQFLSDDKEPSVIQQSRDRKRLCRMSSGKWVTG